MARICGIFVHATAFSIYLPHPFDFSNRTSFSEQKGLVSNIASRDVDTSPNQRYSRFQPLFYRFALYWS